METRVAVIAIIVHEGGDIDELNKILHEYGKYIIGRMGIPYKEKNINIISIAIDATNDVINTLSGRLGRLKEIKVKTLTTGA